MSGSRWTEAGPFADLARALVDPDATHFNPHDHLVGRGDLHDTAVVGYVVTSAGLMPVDETQLAAWRRSYVMVRDEEAERATGADRPVWRRR